MHVVMHVVKEALAATLSLPLPSAADGACAETSVVLHPLDFGSSKGATGFYSLRYVPVLGLNK